MKRFYKNERKGFLGGVCLGIAEYLDIDPIFVRVAFFVFPYTAIVYVVMYFCSEEKPE